MTPLRYLLFSDDLSRTINVVRLRKIVERPYPQANRSAS